MHTKQQYSTYRQSRAKRLPDHDYSSETPVHFTIGAEAGDPFSDSGMAQIVAEAVERTCSNLKFELYAYCVMPNHLHVLLGPKDRDVLQKMKSYTTRQYQFRTGTSVLWQRSARDRLKRVNEPLHRLAAYIADNPVRWGLVEDWLKWPYTKVYV